MPREWTLTTLLLSLTSIAHGQLQHALSFDGNGDQVQVPSASAQIANSTAISLTCWVYPRNGQANWPDMEGFAGFRDDATCDFYLLQTYGTTLEGRFRNGTNVVFTVDSASVLTLNEWQFLALVYDGQSLRMYRNGDLLREVGAFGTIVNTGRALHIGNIPFLSNVDFWLNGSVDEVTVWRRGLTPSELACIMAYGADPADADLRLYYKMDQGVAGGANSGITQLIDAKGTANGNLIGLALNGTVSNFVDGAPIAGSTDATICQDESYDLNGQQLTTAGTYVASYPLPNGCDSLETVRLNVIPVNVAVLENGPVLTAFDPVGPWQWLDCDAGFAPIPGADQQTFVATQTGNFAVIVESNGCADTSACVQVATVGMMAEALGSWRVFHDPMAGQLVVEATSLPVGIEVRVLDAMGRQVMEWNVQGETRSARSTDGLRAGGYMAAVLIGGERRVHRFVLP